jgi:NitT/TauT family transport system substrate-binding protein
MKKRLGIVGACLLGLAMVPGTVSVPATAKEKVTISIISVSAYAAWYIAKEKGFARDIDIDVKIIEDSTARNAGLSSGDIQCMMTTLDSTLVTASAGIPVKHVAAPLVSYGLDQMVATKDVRSDADLRGKSFAADYGFINHMWMLLTLKRAGIPFDEATHKVLLPQEATAAFLSGQLDVDVNFIPFSTQSLKREGSHVLKSTLNDRTWERGLVSDSIACNADWLRDNPDLAKNLVRAWFEAVEWWKENPQAGDEIIAAGLDWSVADVKAAQRGTIMLNLNQNMGALGLSGGRPVCASLPEGVPRPAPGASGWRRLVGGKADCEPGYLAGTWRLFGEIYKEAGVIDEALAPEDGIDPTIIAALAAEGYADRYASNDWEGRLQP